MAHKRPETRVWLALYELSRLSGFEAAWLMWRGASGVYDEITQAEIRRRRRFLARYQAGEMAIQKWNQKVQGA